MDRSAVENVRAGRARGSRSENRTLAFGFSRGLLGGDLVCSIEGDDAYAVRAGWDGEGGVYTLRIVGWGEDVELDLFDVCLCIGSALG